MTSAIFRILFFLLAGASCIQAAPVELDWDDQVWTSNVTVTTRLGDTGNYTYSQSFDVDNDTIDDITFTVTENFSEDLSSLPTTNRNYDNELRFDHVADDASLADGVITLGPFETGTSPTDPTDPMAPPINPNRANEIHNFGDPSDESQKLKIVARDHSRNGRFDTGFDGYLEIKLEFAAHYTLGVTDVTIPLFDIDWRGGERNGNNSQDRVYQVRAMDVDNNEAFLQANYLPWDSDGAGPTGGPKPAVNSYIIVEDVNGNVDQILGGNPDYINNANTTTVNKPAGSDPTSSNYFDLIINPDSDGDASANRQIGFSSNNVQGWGNTELVYNDPTGVKEISFRWGHNPLNADPDGRIRQGSGWGFEIGAIGYTAVVPEASSWIAMGVLVLLLILAHFRRQLFNR